MKKTVKILSLVLAIMLCVFAAAGCGSKNTESKTDDTASAVQTDSEYVIAKGKLVVGITDFEPMDYQNAEGKWIGFDADMATEFAKYLGVDIEFVEIDWDNKVLELNGKTVDCIWNGMTLGDEVIAAMECSKAYCDNAQIVVVPAKDADKYQTAEDCKDLTFAVEAGSAGKDMAVENNFKYTEVTAQADALMEVKAGTCDAAIIDSLMAAAMVGEGTGYADLTYTAKLNSEQYGVGFRKGSDLAEKINTFFDTCTKDGTAEKIASVYGVKEALIK